jgi:predicted aconitase with swiveling domain
VSRAIEAIPLADGTAEGAVFRLAEPLSFWGGLDSATGRIIDRWHPQHGETIAGRVLVMAAGRGSSSGSSVLAEAIRLGSGPVAIVLATRDAIVTVGAMVAAELYGRNCPVVLVGRNDFTIVAAASRLKVESADGRARIFVA